MPDFRYTPGMIWYARIAHCILLPILLLGGTFVHSATFHVTTLGDGPLPPDMSAARSGTDPIPVATLREAITRANANTGPDTITFETSGTIALQAALPALDDTTGGTHIVGGGKIRLDGSGVSGTADGLVITSADNHIVGLTIVNFPAYGIIIEGSKATSNSVKSCYLGNDGTAAMGNGMAGIMIRDSASNNIIGGDFDSKNVISGNLGHGVMVFDNAFSNVITGNLIGTDASGQNALINFGGIEVNGNVTSLYGGIGIYVRNSSDNIIGGQRGIRGNRISGNHLIAISLSSHGAMNNIVQGNDIVTDLDLENDVPVQFRSSGIAIYGGSNIIGGCNLGEENVIDGYWDSHGIEIWSDDNIIQGNLIGGGPAFFENPLHAGIEIYRGRGNLIGGAAPGCGNIIQGRNGFGIYVQSATADQNTFRGNRISGNSLPTIRYSAAPPVDPPDLVSLVPLRGQAEACASIDFFADDENESEHYLGFAVTDGCGNFTSDLDLTPYIGLNLTTTATDETRNTSELSAPIPITADVLSDEGELVAEGEGEGNPADCYCTPLIHTADVDADHLISLNELLRTIQFYRFDEYHCEATTEDGFDIGPGAQDCQPHTADYLPQDWAVSLTELMRTIQFYNSGGYTFCPTDDTEDGYCPAAG